MRAPLTCSSWTHSTSTWLHQGCRLARHPCGERLRSLRANKALSCASQSCSIQRAHVQLMPILRQRADMHAVRPTTCVQSPAAAGGSGAYGASGGYGEGGYGASGGGSARAAASSQASRSMPWISLDACALHVHSNRQQVTSMGIAMSLLTRTTSPREL